MMKLVPVVALFALLAGPCFAAPDPTPPPVPHSYSALINATGLTAKGTANIIYQGFYNYDIQYLKQQFVPAPGPGNPAFTLQVDVKGEGGCTAITYDSQQCDIACLNNTVCGGSGTKCACSNANVLFYLPAAKYAGNCDNNPEIQKFTLSGNADDDDHAAVDVTFCFAKTRPIYVTVVFNRNNPSHVRELEKHVGAHEARTLLMETDAGRKAQVSDSHGSAVRSRFVSDIEDDVDAVVYIFEEYLDLPVPSQTFTGPNYCRCPSL